MDQTMQQSIAPTLTPSLPASRFTLLPTDRPLITHETTFTYFTTRFEGDTSLISTRKETITNYELDTLVKPTRPLILTRTVLKALTESHSLPISHTPPYAVVTNRPQISVGDGPDNEALVHNTDTLISAHDPHESHVHFGSSQPPLPITPTPVTYFTTFTYFTTELQNGEPVVRSREQVISTVVRGKVLPTRVRSLRDRIHRTARSAMMIMSEEQVTKNSDPNHPKQPNSDRQPSMQQGSILDPIPATVVHGKLSF